MVFQIEHLTKNSSHLLWGGFYQLVNRNFVENNALELIIEGMVTKNAKQILKRYKKCFIAYDNEKDNLGKLNPILFQPQGYLLYQIILDNKKRPVQMHAEIDGLYALEPNAGATESRLISRFAREVSDISKRLGRKQPPKEVFMSVHPMLHLDIDLYSKLGFVPDESYKKTRLLVAKFKEILD